MSLTKGTGPFGEQPAGTFNFDPHRPEHVLYLETTSRRVRVLLHGEPVADSDEVRLLHPPGRTPTYLFPREHVRTGLFEASQRRQSDPGMGARTYWTLQAGQHAAADAAYSWEQPPQAAAAIAGLVAFDWDSVSVFEEDEEVFVHPRDPYTRIDVLRSSRRVRVVVAGTVVAESARPRMLIESGLPVRWYLPREDVRTDLLEPSDTTTRCPYKGLARYSSVRLGDRHDKDLVWTYPEPFHDAEAVRGSGAFLRSVLSSKSRARSRRRQVAYACQRGRPFDSERSPGHVVSLPAGDDAAVRLRRALSLPVAPASRTDVRRATAQPVRPFHVRDLVSNLASYCQAVADGTLAPAGGLRGLWRRTVCVLVRTHTAGVPF